VMDALGDNARSRLITWYCNTQLREYRQVFRGNEEAGSLDNISRRYSWFKRMLKTYDDDHAAMFPPYWRVNEMLANAFCEGTREDFRGILSRAARKADGLSLDVDLLLSCLQETLDFEQTLEKRFLNTVCLSTIALTLLFLNFRSLVLRWILWPRAMINHQSLAKLSLKHSNLT